jgi:hypothetical protein
MSEDVSSENDAITVEEAQPDEVTQKDGDDSVPPEERM